MALPELPAQGTTPWYIPRTNWDNAVETELEGRLSAAGVETTIETAAEDRLVVGTRPELYGAVGDGVTDDTAAFSALLAGGHVVVDLAAKAYLIDPDVLSIPEGGMLRGVGSSNIIQGATPVNYSRIVVKNNITTPGTWGVRIGRRGTILGVAIIPSANIPGYQDANFPAGTGIAATGLYLEDNGVVAEDVMVQGFSSIGVDSGNTNRLSRVFVRSCPTGFNLRGNDGIMSECVAMFCMTYGILCTGAFWRYIGNRIEWNAREGLVSAGHATVVGNLFDRNGACGLRMNSGSWGQVISGNHFHRNGAGGDGTNGRWGASVPGHISYVATPLADSCHIKINYQRSVIISGNRYSIGRDDANQGMLSPALIYSSDTTSTGDAPYASSNVGERGATLGYEPTAYSNSGAIAGGTDATLIAHLSRPMSVRDGYETTATVRASGYAPQRSRSANTASFTIDLMPGRAGMVIVTARNSGASHLTVIYFSQDTAGGNKTTLVENKIGTFITAAVLGNNGTNDTLTLTFTGSRGFNYQVQYSDL